MKDVSIRDSVVLKRLVAEVESEKAASAVKVCIGCGKEFKPLHATHRWHNNGCFICHFVREHPGQRHLLGMQPLGFMGNKKVIQAFYRKYP